MPCAYLCTCPVCERCVYVVCGQKFIIHHVMLYTFLYLYMCVMGSLACQPKFTLLSVSEVSVPSSYTHAYMHTISSVHSLLSATKSVWSVDLSTVTRQTYSIICRGSLLRSIVDMSYTTDEDLGIETSCSVECFPAVICSSNSHHHLYT